MNYDLDQLDELKGRQSFIVLFYFLFFLVPQTDTALECKAWFHNHPLMTVCHFTSQHYSQTSQWELFLIYEYTVIIPGMRGRQEVSQGYLGSLSSTVT